MKKRLIELTCFCAAMLFGFLLFSSRTRASTTTEGEEMSSGQNDGKRQESKKPFLVEKNEPYNTGRPTVETEEGIVYTDFEMDPFEVKISNERHGWTLINARTEKYIDQIAHSDWERESLLERDLFTPRRELVYRKQSVPKMIQDSLQSGEKLESFILPGFAGEEYDVEVIDVWTMVNDHGITEGHVRGRLKGDPESDVLIGFYGLRESGSINSNSIGYSLQYAAREDNQVLVREIDPVAVRQVFGDHLCDDTHPQNTVGDPNAEL